MLLQQMMAAQQRDEALLSLASTQKALSQRVVFLANAIDDADAQRQAAADRFAQARRQPSSRRTTTCCSTAPAPTPLSPARNDPSIDRERALRQAVSPRLFLARARRQWLALHLGARDRTWRRPVGDRLSRRQGTGAARRDRRQRHARRLRRARRPHRCASPMPGWTRCSACTGRCSTPPSASSSWSRCSSSGRCRT